MIGSNPAATSPLSIRLFGPFEVQVQGRPLPPLRSRKGFWLLALLVLRQGREVERDWLAGALWPDSEPSDALRNLRISLADLRQALGEQAGRLHSPNTRLLGLDLQEAEVDLIAFDRAMARVEIGSWEQAIALYRGPLLEGCGEAWALLERQTREQAYLQALQRLAAHAEAAGDYPLAIQRLRTVIAIDPTREEAQRALLKTLAEGGDFAAATQAYRDLRLWLHRELHAEPDPQTRALYEHLRQKAQQRPPPPPANLPSPATAPPRRLPEPLTELIGREEEIGAVQARLRQSRLVTLTGTGGVGKTRLAIAVAEAVLEDFPDGVWFVDLAALTEPSLVVQTVGTALEIGEEGGSAPLQTLVQALRERALLIVLDNCEHLVAACAQVVETLLEGCAHLRVLATSRHVLGLTGEAAWRVPSLGLPDRTHAPLEEKDWVAQLREYGGIRLFVERALLVQPAFRLTPHNAGAVAQVCVDLEGIPLAIELAAAWVRVLSVEQIVSRLDQRFRLLGGSGRALLGRQQTLRATLDWSYDLLTEAEKALFMRLAVFAGGNTLEAAEAVCSGMGMEVWEVLNLLTALIDKSLVMAEGNEVIRFRLLETVRQYARDRLMESGEEAAYRRRQRDYFLALAGEARKRLAGAEQGLWLDRLEREHNNLRAALEFCSGDPEGAQAGLRLGADLQRFWWIRGHLSEGRERLSAQLAHPGGQEPTRVRADALNGAGVLAFTQGDYAVAWALYEESLAIRRELEDKNGITASLNNLGLIACEQGNYAQARALYEESLAIARELGDKSSLAYTLNNLGNVANDEGDNAVARLVYEESLATWRELGDTWGIAASLSNLGSVANNQGDYAAARVLHEESLAIRRELGDKAGIAFSLHNLGNAAYAQRDYAQARAQQEESLAIARELGDKRVIACGLAAFASLAIEEAQVERCVCLWGAAAALREAIAYSLDPTRREELERELAAVQKTLSEAVFAAAWAQGRAMTMEQAVAYALEKGEA